MLGIELFLIAFFGSLFPILVWLWFLEHEDKHPEPLKLTASAFIAGMLAVIIVLPFEKIALNVLGNTSITIVVWAFIEEVTKLIVAYIVVLRRIENDEPIDSMMYLIATALGFSALENTLFVFHQLLAGNTLQALVLGNLRFMGATILHIIASGTLGACLALSYYSTPAIKRFYLFFGVILAVILHASFNLSIIFLNGGKAALPLYGVWIVFVVILLVFEKVKHITNFS